MYTESTTGLVAQTLVLIRKLRGSLQKIGNMKGPAGLNINTFVYIYFIGFEYDSS